MSAERGSDPDDVSAAERDMKAFVVNQITDWEKLKILIDSIAKSDPRGNKGARKDQIKLFIIIAEVFQFQILEYLPSIFTILNDKLSKESKRSLIQPTQWCAKQ